MKKYLYLITLFCLPVLLAAKSHPRAKIINGTYIGEFSKNRIDVSRLGKGIRITDGCFTEVFKTNRRGVLTNRSGRRVLIVLEPGVIEIINGKRNSEIYVKRGQRFRDKSRNAYTNIDGRWTNDRLRRSMDIQFTRDGIRARDLDDRNWVNYIVSRYNPNEYTDRRGNTILAESNRRLRWIGFRGREIGFRRR